MFFANFAVKSFLLAALETSGMYGQLMQTIQIRGVLKRHGSNTHLMTPETLKL
jgi:hypothetical protein